MAGGAGRPTREMAGESMDTARTRVTPAGTQVSLDAAHLMVLHAGACGLVDMTRGTQ
jgi:hypothetical protein